VQLAQVIEDPVVLCGTGQVYDYRTIKEWFGHGNRLCPKTNVEVLDVQVGRPWRSALILGAVTARAPWAQPEHRCRASRVPTPCPTPAYPPPQLTRLPWLKDKIQQWMKQNGMAAPHDPNVVEEIRGEEQDGRRQLAPAQSAARAAAAPLAI
jgi:hypothetical protein